MIKINFYPDSDKVEYINGAAEYQEIWATEGERIVTTWEAVSDLEFSEKEINAVIFHGISQTPPLVLRDDLTSERKRAVLIHELGHRLLYGRRLDLSSGLESHKTLFLVLPEVFLKLYDQKFLENAIAADRNLPRPYYGEAWDWALAFTPEQRKEEFRKRLK